MLFHSIVSHLSVPEHLVHSRILELVINLIVKASIPAPNCVPEAEIGQEEAASENLVLHHVA